ncbi:MAG: gamma-butyrobetaine hydroxylase-like domain-containing protein, partial [Planctomycetota bacterium]
MSAVPTDIRQAGPDTLAISWADGSESIYRVFDLRLACPCAMCVDEI